LNLTELVTLPEYLVAEIRATDRSPLRKGSGAPGTESVAERLNAIAP